MAAENIEIIYNTLTSDLGERRQFDKDGGSDGGDMSYTEDTTCTYVTHSVDSIPLANTEEDHEEPPSEEAHKEEEEEELKKDVFDKKSEKDLFDKARQYLNPGPLFRFFTYLYAERKLLTFFWVHFIATLVVWGHFAMQKFDEQSSKVPLGANRYWWKVMVPTFEFGAMHAILFQMALIPLTMCRSTISSLSETAISRFVPMNRMLRIHIHLGFIMVSLVFLATILFFTFFGTLCTDGEQAFCNKMRSEIMITGYIILAFLLILGGTSFFRHSMPYEVFYGIHHIAILLYIITIIHTFDREQRSGNKVRSQTFKWFSSTLLYYFCDRASMALNHRYTTQLVASSTVAGTTSNESKMIILRLRRPVLFHFKPGQYAQLRLKELDISWHPFSIASGPGSSCLEFYIEVFGEKSWSNKLWHLLQEDVNGERRIEFEIMGPYGTALGKTEDYSHAIALGTGTGIVPVLSLYKQHVRQLLRLEPVSFLRTLEERQKKIIEVECARDERKGSIASKVTRPCFPLKAPIMEDELEHDELVEEDELAVSNRVMKRHKLRSSICRHGELDRWDDLRDNIKAMKNAAFVATRSIYGVVLLSFMPVLGIALLGLTISWNTCNFELRYGMIESLQGLTVVFQTMFAFVAFFIWDGTSFFAFTDAVICILTPFCDWFWFLQYAHYEQLRPCDVTLYSILIGYMTARLWSMVVRPRDESWRRCVMRDDGFGGTLDRLEMVWVTRSASLVSKIMPEIHVLWDTLVSEWGRENAAKVCCIAIHITDPDEVACEILRQEFADLDLYKAGAVRFGRPDFCEIIENHTLEMVATRSKSNSLLAFCGSSQLAQEIHRDKISNDMVAAITGNKQHQMEYVSESYGGCKSSKVHKKSLTKSPSISDLGSLGTMGTYDTLSKRKTVAYATF